MRGVILGQGLVPNLEYNYCAACQVRNACSRVHMANPVRSVHLNTLGFLKAASRENQPKARPVSSQSPDAKDGKDRRFQYT